MAISITDPLNAAYQRTALMTFRPFKLENWFVLGFIAWLAGLGEGGGGANFNNFDPGMFKPKAPPAPPMPAPRPWPPTTFPSTSTSTSAPTWTPPPDPFQPALDWIKAHVGTIVLIAIAAIVLIVAISLVILWINSRGKFMFLHAIANNSLQVKAPWQQYRPLANSLLGFRIYLALIWMLSALVILGVCGLIAWPNIRAQHFGTGAITALILLFVLMIPTMLLFGVVGWVTNTFVTTIMYARGSTVMDAWREFRTQVMPGNVGKLVLFMLMNLLLGIGVGIAQVLVGCVTCCIGFLPYLSSVAGLPLLLFMRCYSIYFLQQFGPQYVIIQEGPPPPTRGAFPVVGTDFPPTAYPYEAPGPYQPPDTRP